MKGNKEGEQVGEWVGQSGGGERRDWGPLVDKWRMKVPHWGGGGWTEAADGRHQP